MFLFTFLYLLLAFLVNCANTTAIKCGPKAGDNIHDHPQNWCSIHASITTGHKPCDLQVKERLTIPWVTKFISRVLITPHGIVDLKSLAASQLVEEKHSTFQSVGVKGDPDGSAFRINTTIESLQPLQKQVTFVLKYTITGGIRIFDDCPEDNGMFNKTNGTMMAMWQPGIVFPLSTHEISATFILPFLHVDFIPKPYGIPSPINMTQTDRTTMINFEVTKYDAKTAFYTRFTPRKASKLRQCSGYRVCDTEYRAGRQKPRKTSAIGLRLWLGIGCAMILGAFVVALIAICCMRRGKAAVVAAAAGQESDNSQFSVLNGGGFMEKSSSVVDTLPRTEDA